MPRHRERVAHKATRKHPPEQRVENIGRHLLGKASVGQVAVMAVEITERSRLDDEEIERTELSTAPRCHHDERPLRADQDQKFRQFGQLGQPFGQFGHRGREKLPHRDQLFHPFGQFGHRGRPMLPQKASCTGLSPVRSASERNLTSSTRASSAFLNSDPDDCAAAVTAGGATSAVVARTKLPAPAWRSVKRLDLSRDRADFSSSIVATTHSAQGPGLKSVISRTDSVTILSPRLCTTVCLTTPPGISLAVHIFSVHTSSPLLVTASTHSTASFLPLTVISSLPSVADASGPVSVLTSLILTLAG